MVGLLLREFVLKRVNNFLFQPWELAELMVVFLNQFDGYLLRNIESYHIEADQKVVPAVRNIPIPVRLTPPRQLELLLACYQ